MKIILERKKILESIIKVHSVIEKRNIMPILEHIKIEIISPNIVKLTTTDLDITVSHQFNITHNYDIAFTVVAQQLYDIIKKLTKSDFIELDLENINNGQVEILANQTKITIPCLNIEEFPSFEDSIIDNDNQFEIHSNDLRKILSKTKHAISSGEMRYYLNGIFLKTENNLLVAVATDVHRLAISFTNLPNNLSISNGIIIPKKTVNEIIKMIEGEMILKGSITYNKLILKANSTTLTSKLVYGTYPNYSSLFTIQQNKRFSVDVNELENATDLVSTISGNKVKIVNLELSTNNILTVFTDSNKDGKHAAAKQEIVVESYIMNNLGDYIENSFCISLMLNAKYLLDILHTTTGPRIHFNILNSESPIIINDTADYASKYVLMPMQIETNH